MDYHSVACSTPLDNSLAWSQKDVTSLDEAMAYEKFRKCLMRILGDLSA
jgi:hypothetical protein